MRGDSLQDFYAKALALIGLGVLAGAGALVDYWPTSQRLPDVARALTLPGTTPVVAATSLARFLPASTGISAAVRQVPAAGASAAIGTRTAMASSTSAATLLPSTRSDITETPATLAHVPAPVAASTLVPGASNDASAAATSMTALDPVDPGTAERASDPMSLVQRDDTAGTAMASTTPGVTGGSGDDSSFLTGAVKRTGSSIMRGGTKTGTSIVGAFRALGGAVRRAFPG